MEWIKLNIEISRWLALIARELGKLTPSVTEVSHWVYFMSLTAIVYAAMIRLTDGKREQMVERIALWLVAVGAFSQIARGAFPDGVSFDVNLMNIGMAIWALVEVYKVGVRKEVGG